MSVECCPESRTLSAAPAPVHAESSRPPPLRSSPEYVGVEHDTTSRSAELSLTPSLPSTTLFFRVTGAASVARLEPLLLNRQWRGGGVKWSPVRAGAETVAVGPRGDRDDRTSVLDFVWETTVTKDQRRQHRSARVLNRLSGAQVEHIISTAVL